MKAKRKTKFNRLPQHIETTSGPASTIGDVAVLRANKLAIICSQKCPGDVILKAYDLARLVRGPGRAIVSGFHSPIEKDCLPILLRGGAPIIIVQAHRLSTTRLPLEWQKAINAGRLLLISPFTNKQKRVTAKLAGERNHFVVTLAEEVLIAYANPGGRTERLAAELFRSGKRVYTFESPANKKLIEWGAVPVEPTHFSPIREDAKA